MSNQITPNPSVPSQVVQEVKFPKFVNNLGIIPTSYKDSMSYYECLAWFCKFLEETVIPTVNQNGEAIQELQNLYVELNSYVAHYFDNLDVQQEINNKLDKMIQDGTINVIIGSYITELDTQMIQLSQKVENIENHCVTTEDSNVITLGMLTQEVRESITGGSTAVIGINSVGSENIKNKAVDVLHLSDSLSASFSNSLTEINLDDLTNLQGYARGNVGSTLSFASDTNYHYKIIDLTKDVIYSYVGNIFMAMNGIVIVNSEDEIIWTTRDTTQNSDLFKNIIFRPYENGMKAYINYKNAEATSFADLKALSYISATTPITYEAPLQKIKEIPNTYTRADQSYSTGQIMFSTTANSNCDVYRMHKGQKYTFTGTNFYLLAALAITDDDYQVQYISSQSSQGTAQSVSYTFTAQNDGYILCSSLSSSYPYSLQIVPRNNEYNYISNLRDKNLCYTGDSICYGAGYTGGYAKIIKDDTLSNMQNIAVGGGTIADGTTYEDSTPRFHICNSISSLSTSADAVIINGGCNDYWNNVTIGTLTDDYDDVVDKNTFIGALEYMFRACMNRYYDIPIVFVINHNINNINFTTNSLGKTFNDYRNAIYQACEKYGVKIVDIGKDTPFNTYFDDQKNNLTNSNDGIHPNESGYNAFYVPLIKSTLEMLI